MKRFNPIPSNDNYYYYINALSIKKNKHLINQDAFAINDIAGNQEFDYQQIKITLLNNCSIAVSDGVSNSHCSNFASKEAVTLFNQGYCFDDINTILLNHNSGSCTLSSLSLNHDLATSQSVGDSAIILVRDKQIKYLTFDQDFKSRLYLLNNEKSNPNILEHYLSYLNFDKNSINKNIIQIKDHDCFYLVSDGYKKHLSNRKFEKLIKQDKLIKYFQLFKRPLDDDLTIIKIVVRSESR